MDHVANACRNGPRRLPYVASGEERVVPKEIAEVNKKLRRGKRGRAEEEKRREEKGGCYSLTSLSCRWALGVSWLAT